MRCFLNLPVLNNDDRHSTKQENIRPALQVCIRTATGHKHTDTWGVMHREMKYSAGGFWWRVLNQSQCCHSNLKTSTGSSPPLPFSRTSTSPLLEGLCLLSLQCTVIVQMFKFPLFSRWENPKIINILGSLSSCLLFLFFYSEVLWVVQEMSWDKGIGEGQQSPQSFANSNNLFAGRELNGRIMR